MRTAREALREAVESGAVNAWTRGGEIQFRHDGSVEWCKLNDPTNDCIPAFGNGKLHWRPTPAKKRLPFTLDTVPKGAIWCANNWPDSIYVITGYNQKGVTFGPPAAPSEHSYEELSSWSSYSLDGGLTWRQASQEVES